MGGAGTIKKHPVVLRFEGMFPDQLDGYEGHRQRIRGDDGNIVREKSHLNKLLIGGADWAAQARAEVEAMRVENFADELEELKRRKRVKDLHRRLAEGPKDPWRKSRHGPMRELILTANSEWFAAEADSDGKPLSPELREATFEMLAVQWLKAEFGDDVVHARADRDEIAYHVHAVILPRETKAVNGATRRMLRPSKFAIIEDYEKAQDSVGEWFAMAGLTRGERRAEAVRDARERSETPPPKPRHTRPHAWRKAEEARLALLDGALTRRAEALEKRKAELDQRAAQVDHRETVVGAREAAVANREARAANMHAEAEAVVAAAEQIAVGALDVAPDGPKAILRPSGAAGADLSDLLARLSKGGAFVRRALDAFGKLRERLNRQADERVRAREAQVERDLVEIRAADDRIVEIAGVLPEAERSRIAGLRASLAAPITRLKLAVRRRAEPREGSSERD